jgi:drug/metabolite transporter (DMT)-like permease
VNIKSLRADFLLLLTALIWGLGFVAQRSGMEYIGPFTYNAVRFPLGVLLLIPFIIYRHAHVVAFKAMLITGICLFLAVTFQQLGMMVTTAGNAGFITGLYVIFVPIVGIFWGKKIGALTWFGVVCTLIGLYCISLLGQASSFNPGDVFVLVSACFWTMHVLLIDRFMQQTHIDPVVFSSGQFFWCGIFSLIAAVSIESYVEPFVVQFFPEYLQSGLFSWLNFNKLIADPHLSSILHGALVPVLYGGFGSVGIAYTLQVVAQRDAQPTHAVIILCLEGLFAAIGGILLLNEQLTLTLIIGFALMLGGMIASQIDSLKQN